MPHVLFLFLSWLTPAFAQDGAAAADVAAADVAVADAAAAIEHTGTFWMPPQASTLAQEVDFVFYFIYWVCMAFFVVMMGAMIYFAVKYKMKEEGEKTSPIKGSHSIELAWAVLPSFLLVAFFWVGFKAWMNQNVPPADSMEVRVVGQKWSWMFHYPDRGVISDKLVVPADTPVQLTMSSKDVLHSFFVPAFRIKKDVLPNRYTVIWFEAKERGEFQVFCTEYCGTGHSTMLNTVEVLEPNEFNYWVYEQKNTECETSADCGAITFKQKGCAGCHSVDGTKLVGPSLAQSYGRTENLEGGGTATIDDNYIRESIMEPNAKIVAGYAPSMPSFKGQLDDQEVNELIDYIKSLN